MITGVSLPLTFQGRSQLMAPTVLASMAVLPEHQGKGIAKRLLFRVAEVADEAGKDIYLDSTPGAKRLYQSVGFEVLEDFVIRDEFPMTAMLRKARSKS